MLLMLSQEFVQQLQFECVFDLECLIEGLVVCCRLNNTTAAITNDARRVQQVLQARGSGPWLWWSQMGFSGASSAKSYSGSSGAASRWSALKCYRWASNECTRLVAAMQLLFFSTIAVLAFCCQRCPRICCPTTTASWRRRPFTPNCSITWHQGLWLSWWIRLSRIL